MRETLSLGQIAARRLDLSAAITGVPPSEAFGIFADELAGLAWAETQILNEVAL